MYRVFRSCTLSPYSLLTAASSYPMHLLPKWQKWMENEIIKTPNNQDGSSRHCTSAPTSRFLWFTDSNITGKLLYTLLLKLSEPWFSSQTKLFTRLTLQPAPFHQLAEAFWLKGSAMSNSIWWNLFWKMGIGHLCKTGLRFVSHKWRQFMQSRADRVFT